MNATILPLTVVPAPPSRARVSCFYQRAFDLGYGGQPCPDWAIDDFDAFTNWEDGRHESGRDAAEARYHAGRRAVCGYSDRD